MSAGEAADQFSSASRRGVSTLVSWWSRWRPDRVRLAYATNIALVTVLALYAGFLLNLQNTYWGLITIPFVAQMGSGITVWRSTTRVVGTVIGGIVGVAIVAAFAQDAGTSIAALALWVLGVGYLARFEVGFDAYAYGTAGLTAAVIVFDTGSNADLAYGYALARLTETLIPVGAAFAVLLVVFPRSVEGTLRQGLLDARDAVLAVIHQALTPGEKASVKDRQVATKALSAAYSNLRAYRFERSHRGPDVARVAAAANRLNHLLVASETLSLVLGGDGGTEPPDRISRPLQDLRHLLSTLPKAFGGAARAGEVAQRFHAFASRFDDDPQTRLTAADVAESGSQDVATLHAMRRFAIAMAAFLKAEAAVFDPERATPEQRPIAARYPDHVAAIQRGLRPALMLTAAATLWIASASPSFQAVALLAGAMSLVLPTIAPRPTLARAGTAIGLGIAAMAPVAILLQVVLPYVESFPIFAAILASVMFVLFYICSAPGKLVYAFGGTIMIAITLQPSNAQTYNILGLFNTGAALALLPAAIAVAFTVVIPENQAWLRRHLRRGSRNLLARAAEGRDDGSDEFLAQSLDVLGDYGGDLDVADETDKALLRRSRLSVIAGLELYELHRMRRLRHLPEDLGVLVPRLGETVLAAAWGGTRDEGEARRHLFGEARRIGRAHADDEAASGSARAAALRFLIGSRFLEDAVEKGFLPESEGRNRHAA